MDAPTPPTGPADAAPPDSPARPLREALARLVSRGTLTAEQADAVLAETLGAAAPVAATRPERPRRTWTSVLAEVGAYVGGAFVVAAIAVFTGQGWHRIGTAGRLVVLGVPAVLLLAAAVGVAGATPGGWSVHEREGTGPWRRLVATLVLGAGGLLAGVTAVIAHAARPHASGGAAAATLITGTLLVVWALGYLACRSPLLQLGCAAAAAAMVIAGLNWADPSVGPAAIGVGLLVLGAVWAGLALVRVLDERALGLITAAVMGFAGAETMAQGGSVSRALGYLAMAGIAVAGLVGYVSTRLVAVLVVGVVALATVVPQAVIDYTGGALGAAGALLVVGLSIVGASVLGLRLRHEVPGRVQPAS
jgi:hypothetical protein